MGAIHNLGQTLAFMDVVAEGEGRGGDYISDELKREAAESAKNVIPLVSAAAEWAAGAWLASKLPNVQLDKDAPFSDASLSNALSQVLGVKVASVRDREALKAAFRAAVTARVSAELGYTFQDVFDKNLIKIDVLRWLGQHASEVVPGLELSDLSSREATIADIELYGRRVLSDATGVNFKDLRSKQQIKEDIYAFCLPYIEEMIGKEQDGSEGYKEPLKMDLKSIRRREAVRRFRAKWGDRQEYMGVRGG